MCVGSPLTVKGADHMLEDAAYDLTKLKREELTRAWKEHLHSDPPLRLRKEVMASLLAYRIQVREQGDLSQAARRRLKEFIEQLDGKQGAGSSVTCKAGTRLVRSWKGELHGVTGLDEGFEYRGNRFATLSGIAREITGTRWSGPVFFGLREKATR